ncbi:hypothetical protein [Streptomyces sp. GC420]|uniref:hypothetical protein n=1 Tax=Streptomyces sp. GC420 TaxID=2697568 RepID=UPI0028BD6DEA|nr:hypothetical protein [Streptomyces sp. GC420]
MLDQNVAGAGLLAGEQRLQSLSLNSDAAGPWDASVTAGARCAHAARDDQPAHHGHDARGRNALSAPGLAGGHHRHRRADVPVAAPAVGRRIPRLHIETVEDTELLVGAPTTGRTTVHVDELVDAPWPATASSSAEPMLGVWPGLPGRPRIVHTTRDWLTKLQLVSGGFGVTTVPFRMSPVLPHGVSLPRVDRVPPGTPDSRGPASRPTGPGHLCCQPSDYLGRLKPTRYTIACSVASPGPVAGSASMLPWQVPR